MILRRRIAAQQLRHVVDAVHQQIQIAVVIEIAHRHPAPRHLLQDPRPHLLRHLLKLAVPQIPVHQLPLPVSRFVERLAHFRIDMPVALHDVRPAVIVVVHERNTPAQKARNLAHPGLKRLVLKYSAAEIAIQTRSVAREIRLHQVEVPVAIVVRHRHAHARLRLAVGRVRHSRLDRDLLKRPVVIVLVQRRRGRIVGHVNIRPPVVVEIENRHAQPERARRLQNPRLLRHVGERAVSVVVEQNVLSALQSRRTASHRQSLVLARTRFGQRRGLRVELEIVRHEQVQMPVLVVVHEGASGVIPLAPVGRPRGHPSLRRHIHKLSVP